MFFFNCAVDNFNTALICFCFTYFKVVIVYFIFSLNHHLVRELGSNGHMFVCWWNQPAMQNQWCY